MSDLRKTKDDCLPIKLVNVAATPAAIEVIHAADQTLDYFLGKHQMGDWGNLTDEDGEFYDRALINGSAVEGEYITDGFDRIWIYTAIGQYTSVYLPDER